VADSPRIEELKRRVQSDPASIAFAALAEEYRRAGRFDEAIDTCTTGLVRHPSYLSAHVTLGRALIEVGRLQEARGELEYVLKLAPENLAAIRGLAEIHHRIGDEPIEHMVEDGETAAAPEPAAPPEAAPTPPLRIAVKTRVEDKPEQQRPIPIQPSHENHHPPVEPAPAFVASAGDGNPELSMPSAVKSPPVLIKVSSYMAPAVSEPHVTPAASVDPTLAGLEEFLDAITRARAERASGR
jgi:tetratricopeptide (TPR) repeat protein